MNKIAILLLVLAQGGLAQEQEKSAYLVVTVGLDPENAEHKKFARVAKEVRVSRISQESGSSSAARLAA